MDGSVAISWFFDDEANPYADGIAARLRMIDVFVPNIWKLEVANALLMGERRNRSDRANTVRWSGFLASMTIKIDAQTNDRAFVEILDLARDYGLTTYDASYLELAMRLGIPLATLDKKLAAAAPIAGVTLYQVP